MNAPRTPAGVPVNRVACARCGEPFEPDCADTLLVRLKPYDPRRGHVLRRYTYAGIKFQEEHGWYRVEKAVAEYLRNVREDPNDRYSPLAFDVCTEAEVKALEAAEKVGELDAEV